MILSLNQLRTIEPRALLLEEAPISSEPETHPCGWHCSVVANDHSVLGSGFHLDQETARKIAIAETVERALYRRIWLDPLLRQEFQLSEHPSSCGFAAGFDSETTKRRALAEAAERWAWSKWIDEGYCLNPVTVASGQAGPLALRLSREFDEVIRYEQQLTLNSAFGLPSAVKFTVLIGIKNNGAFPGSRITAMGEDGSEHAMIEAWRHKLIFDNLRDHPADDLVNGRIKYFGSHANEAKATISRANYADWPAPKLKALRELAVEIDQNTRVFLARAICSDYRGWHEGDIKRFVF